MALKELLFAAGILTATSTYAVQPEFGWGLYSEISSGSKEKPLDFETNGQLSLKVPYGIKISGLVGVRLDQSLPNPGEPLIGFGAGLEKKLGSFLIGAEASRFNSHIQRYKTIIETGQEKTIIETKDLTLFKLYVAKRILSKEKTKADIVLSFMRVDGEFTNQSLYGEYTEPNSEDYKIGLGFRISK
ncbi:hypothetical protein HOG16_01955 [Candidatus Woesearchaeota archaeon]|jgi:hypothetical protein|nr:hypothetical protein [Candidatus Woesearchaeota archaeon]MBT4321667.1 hypothetical protein [Candidatus Woesearchaeota archaeon]MBT4631022.1 hypothetical protein [Candidatus Woesearchaeota archaeon]